MSIVPPRRDAAGQDAALDALYAELPTISCMGMCHASCGPILMSRREWARIKERVPVMPSMDPETLACPLLTARKLCSVYPVRPAICRLFGVADGLTCPFGCQPSRLMTRAEVRVWLARVDAAGE